MNRNISAIIVVLCLLLPGYVYAGITVTNPGNGSGTIGFRTMSGGILLESCSVSAVGACNVGVSQDTANGNVIDATAAANSYFSGWSAPLNNVSGCSNTTRTCNITGSTAAGGPHSVNARFNACAFTLGAQNASFTWSGGAGNIAVTAADSTCSWIAAESLDWVSLTSGANATGSGTVSYSVAVNRTAAARNGVITVGGANFALTQSAYIGKISVAPDPVAFGTIMTNLNSELAVKISNIGTTALNISAMDITGTNSSEFTKHGSCSAIAAGNLCAVKLALRPQTTGAKTANLVITSDDPAYPVYTLPLSGTASANAAANISVNPAEITISSIDLEMGDVRTVSISNPGAGSLIINSINIKGPEAVEFLVNNSCTVISPGSSCSFTVSGFYSSNKPKRAFVVISSNAQNAPRIEIPINASTGACSGSTALSATAAAALYVGSNGTFEVTKTGETACLWSAASKASWINGSQSGNTVSYTVASNTSNALRTGAINVAGHPFTVIQYGSANNTTFNDISGSYFTAYINAIYSQGITTGCVLNSSYCPQDTVTRGAMAAFIIRALYGEDFAYTLTPYFSDVAATHGFFKYVQRMRDDGITLVTGSYDVDGVVTRGAMAAFIIRAIYGENFSYTLTPYFSDVPATHGFFKYVQKMKDTGVTTVSNIYDVDGAVIREHMAAFLARAFLGME